MKYKLLIIIHFIFLSAIANAYKNIEFVVEFGGKGEALGKISEKVRFAFDKDGNIYILDIDNLRVQKLDPNGKPLMEISSETDFMFTRPMDIAVDKNSNIYVVDWKAFHINNTENPKIFNYGPCIYKFTNDGKYNSTFTIDDLSKKLPLKEKASPAIDTDGNFALMIMPDKVDRQIYLSVDSIGNIYVLDQDSIYKLDPSGKLLINFSETGGKPGQLDKPTGITIDINDNIYVADTGNSRISKFSHDGKFLMSFGKKGYGNGEFFDELYIQTTLDGMIMVADSAKYEKLLKTSMKRRKILDSTTLVTGQDDPILLKTREFEKVMMRIQIFDENGKYRDKILYTIDKSDPELKDIELRAIDHLGNIYFIDKDRLAILKYTTQEPFALSSADKTFTLRFLYNEKRTQLDDFFDLNDYYDFDERQKYNQITAIFKLNYDLTESYSISFASSLSYLNGKTIDKYPGEYADPYGYIQDDETIDRYTSARIRIDIQHILNHDLFKYRVGNLFVYFGGGKYKYRVDAMDINNYRLLNERLWWMSWAAGIRYDMGGSLRLTLTAAQHRPIGYMNYEYIYWDERGELYSTGAGNGRSTEFFISLDGVF